MEEKFVTWDVHNEFEKRVVEENDRQNHRIAELEITVKEISRLTTSVEKMAVSMESMATEQKKQGERLDKIEDKPAQRWEQLVTAIITGIIGIVIGLVSAGILK